MTTDNKALVPVWTLATEAVSVSNVLDDEGMTPARLAELRTVLATLADSPSSRWKRIRFRRSAIGTAGLCFMQPVRSHSSCRTS